MGEHFDVIVVGAGISGIGAACHLQMSCPGRTYTILEGRDSIGGTWDLFRYPGVRSDSDMNTLGYEFKPWTAERSIADGQAILEYLRETVDEYGIEPHIRYRHHVSRAEWSSETSTWTIQVSRSDTGEITLLTCNFLFMCSGYYSYESGHTPEFSGRDRFRGQIVHPQEWPADLDYSDKRVVVIGSGATAITLLPAMAPDAAHVTILQRSPSYVIARPDPDPITKFLRRWLPERLVYRLIRRKNTFTQTWLYNQTRIRPERVKKQLLARASDALGPAYVEQHFTPTYDPWDERLCLIPNGDLFKAIKSGKASVVTDHIETFTETGIDLEAGEHLDADIIVTAPGLQWLSLGGVEIMVDDKRIDFAETWSYKGFAYSDVPNLVSLFGYVNASWTLRADMICDYVCRLLNHMESSGTTRCTPRLRPSDRNMPERPWIDGFTPGYLERVMPTLPKQGNREPWLNTQHYSKDLKLIRDAPVDDDVMCFDR